MFTPYFYMGSNSSSGSFSPHSISGLNLWLDASDASTVTAVSGATSGWADKSGFAYNAAQANGSLQPVYSIGTQNGLNVLTFAEGRSLVVDSRLVAADEYSVLCVFSSSISDSASHAGFYIAPSLLVYGIWTGATNWGSFRAAGPTASSYSVFNHLRSCAVRQFTPTSFDLSTNLNAPETQSADRYTALTTSTIGTDQYSQLFQGTFAEIIYYNRAITDIELGTLQNYLIAKWGLV